VEPPAPLVTALTAAPAAGGIQVTVAQPAAVGTQPATQRIDLYRRRATYVAPVNTNPYFETNATDWSNAGYATAARSTVIAHQGTGSILLTPNGSTATPYIQTTAIYPIGAVQRWQAGGWFRSTTANKAVRIKLQWYDVSNALISETVRDYTAVAAGWVYAVVEGPAPGAATGVRLGIGQLATPAAGDTVYADELILIQSNQDAGIRVGYGVTSGETVLDWRAVTGVDYEYRAYAEGPNRTVVHGPWQS
jgi:hypothetical protein